MSSLNLDLTISNRDCFCVRVTSQRGVNSWKEMQTELQRGKRERARNKGELKRPGSQTQPPHLACSGDVLTGRKGPLREEGGRWGLRKEGMMGGSKQGGRWKHTKSAYVAKSDICSSVYACLFISALKQWKKLGIECRGSAFMTMMMHKNKVLLSQSWCKTKTNSIHNSASLQRFWTISIRISGILHIPVVNTQPRIWTVEL